jgi:hypothetical protein
MTNSLLSQKVHSFSMSSAHSRAASPTISDAVRLRNVGLSTIEAIIHTMDVTMFIFIWSAIFATFIALETPSFGIFLSRCSMLIVAISITQMIGNQLQGSSYRRAFGRSMVYIGSAYYVINASHSDFMVSILSSIGVAIICQLFE